MKKRLIIRSLIGLVVGALAVHAITLFVNYISRGEILICMPQMYQRKLLLFHRSSVWL
jgi:hypothetical protein